MSTVVMSRFLSGCIPLRILLAVGSTYIPEAKLKLFSVVLFGISMGLLYLYFANKRLDAPEAGGEGTWWSNLRLIHGLLYLCAAIYAYQGKREYVWIPLTIDVIVGLLAFLHHTHSRQ